MKKRACFLKVKCICSNEQIIFEHSKSEVRCLVCNEVIGKSTGGKIKLDSRMKVLERLE
ncbi:MAG: 30S ribosomal protein S27e [Candidatus Micrarchaeota archaeon]|nr:30S ribosomal protein S27e [Candidatus Micrarchaeota archaeon]